MLTSVGKYLLGLVHEKAYKTSGPMDEDDEPAGFEEDGMMGHDDEYVF